MTWITRQQQRPINLGIASDRSCNFVNPHASHVELEAKHCIFSFQILYQRIKLSYMVPSFLKLLERNQYYSFISHHLDPRRMKFYPSFGSMRSSISKSKPFFFRPFSHHGLILWEKTLYNHVRTWII